MYTPPHFAAQDIEDLHRIMNDNPLGTIVRQGAHGLDADHIPLFFDPQEGRSGTCLWKMGDSAPEFIHDMLKQIVGIHITITSLTGKRKLSQNKDKRDRDGAINALGSHRATDLCAAMRDVTP